MDWISVLTGIPDMERTVLVHFENGEILTGKFYATLENGKVGFEVYKKYAGPTIVRWDSTHWRELPPPPTP